MHPPLKLLLFPPLLLLSLIAFGQSNSVEKQQQLLIGKWKSMQDRNYNIVVSDSIREYYKKAQTGSYAYKIEDNHLTQISSDGEIFEYEIMSLSKKYLCLMYLQRGNLLNFKRIKSNP